MSYAVIHDKEIITADQTGYADGHKSIYMGRTIVSYTHWGFKTLQEAADYAHKNDGIIVKVVDYKVVAVDEDDEETGQEV